MLKDENGKIIFTADDCVEWINDVLQTRREYAVMFPSRKKRERDFEESLNVGLEFALDIIKSRQQRALEAEARKAEEETGNV